MVRRVGRFEVGQVDDRRAQRGELVDVGVVADPGDAAPDLPREKQRPVVLGQDDVERLARFAEAAHLRLEHVDIDIGRGEKHVTDLVRVTQVARNLDLPERFHRHPIAHRVGEHIHLFGIARQQKAQRMLEAVASRGGAVEVIDIGGGLAARRPGEQHRHAWSFRVVSKLRQAVEPLGEHRVEAVNEQEHFAVTRRPFRKLSVQRLNERLVAVEISFVADDKIDIRVTGRRGRPFDLARLMVRRDRDGQLGVVGRGRSVAVEERARPLVTLPRRRDEQGMIDRAGGTIGHGAEEAGLRPRGAANEREDDNHDRQNGKRSPRPRRRAKRTRRPFAPRSQPRKPPRAIASV